LVGKDPTFEKKIPRIYTNSLVKEVKLKYMTIWKEWNESGIWPEEESGLNRKNPLWRSFLKI